MSAADQPGGDAASLVAALANKRVALEERELERLRRSCSTGLPTWVLRAALGQRLFVEDPRSVALLLESGAPPDPPQGWGGTGGALFACLWEGRSVAVLRLLLDAGADPALSDRAGRTPWSLARRLAADEAAAELAARGHATTHDAALDELLQQASRGDEQAVGELLAGDPGLAGRLAHEDHALLGRALRRGDRHALPALLAAGLDPSQPDQGGATALHEAARARDVESARRFRARGASPRERDHAGRTVVGLALELGGRDFARALVATEIHATLELGETHGFPSGDEALDALLYAHAAVPVPADREDRFERAVLAVIDGEPAALAEHLDADPGLACARSSRPHHATLLHYVGANGVEDERQRTPPNAVAMLELLLTRGAQADATCDTYGGGTAQTTLCLLASSDHPRKAGLQGPLVRALVRGGARVDGLRGDGEPLATAIAFRQPDAVRALIDSGARVDNPLYAAATGEPARVLALLDESGGARAGVPRATVPWLQQSSDPRRAAGQALAVAAMLGHKTLVRALAERGVDPSSPLGDGNAALHEAAYAGHGEVVALLLKLGADPRARDGQWRSTPLVWAHAGGREATRELLLERAGADLVDCADLGLTAVARTLLANGADPEGPQGDGWPLRLAAAEGRLGIVELLLAHGADRERRDARGRTPLAIARLAEHAAVVAALEG